MQTKTDKHGLSFCSNDVVALTEIIALDNSCSSKIQSLCRGPYVDTSLFKETGTNVLLLGNYFCCFFSSERAKLSCFLGVSFDNNGLVLAKNAPPFTKRKSKSSCKFIRT